MYREESIHRTQFTLASPETEQGPLTMAALQSAFKERFEDMESTRNQRLSLLQAEKALQKNKSLVLSSKFSNIRLLEQHCLILDHKFASDNFRISSLKSEIEFLDTTYQSCAQQLRDLTVEVDELEQLEIERGKFYAPKYAEMQEFTDETHKFAADIRNKVGELRRRRDETVCTTLESSKPEEQSCNNNFKLKSVCSKLQKNNGKVQNLDIQAAELRHSEILALKKKVANTLESNKRERAELQKQLQSLG